jgi:hypothetical protein
VIGCKFMIWVPDLLLAAAKWPSDAFPALSTIRAFVRQESGDRQQSNNQQEQLESAFETHRGSRSSSIIDVTVEC